MVLSMLSSGVDVRFSLVLSSLIQSTVILGFIFLFLSVFSLQTYSSLCLNSSIYFSTSSSFMDWLISYSERLYLYKLSSYSYISLPICLMILSSISSNFLIIFGINIWCCSWSCVIKTICLFLWLFWLVWFVKTLIVIRFFLLIFSI